MRAVEQDMEAEMHLDVERQLRTTHEPLSIVVGGEIWDLYVFGVTRVERDWWVQIAVVGPRSCTVTVRVDAANGRGAAAHEIIRLVTDWLLEDEASDHAFLEHSVLEARAS
jgi:hypothetical protein